MHFLKLSKSKFPREGKSYILYFPSNFLANKKTARPPKTANRMFMLMPTSVSSSWPANTRNFLPNRPGRPKLNMTHLKREKEKKKPATWMSRGPHQPTEMLEKVYAVNWLFKKIVLVYKTIAIWQIECKKVVQSVRLSMCFHLLINCLHFMNRIRWLDVWQCGLLSTWGWPESWWRAQWWPRHRTRRWCSGRGRRR